MKRSFGWGDETPGTKKEEDKNTPYYNVFFSKNPLKTAEGSQMLWFNQFHGGKK